MPTSSRRRTPGLRREEVATLAGVSVDYLVRLEQGRDAHPSVEVLAALADAMRMTEDERHHLFRLGAISVGAAMCPAPSPVVHDVAPTVVALLERLQPTPAFVLGPAADVLAWNDAWTASSGPSGCSTSRTSGPTWPATCSAIPALAMRSRPGGPSPTSRPGGCVARSAGGPTTTA